MDLDGVLVIAQSEKQDAAATWKEAFRHHPLTGFVDHGAGGSGEPVVGLPRPGNAGSVMGADHIEAARPALAQLPKKYRRGRGTLIRCDDGARAAEPAGDCPKEWPMGTRLIVRRERPHPGAQLRHTDADGMRLPRFATNVKDVPIAEPELRHRWRARAEDRVRAARSTGLRDLPSTTPHGTDLAGDHSDRPRVGRFCRVRPMWCRRGVLGEVDLGRLVANEEAGYRAALFEEPLVHAEEGGELLADPVPAAAHLGRADRSVGGVRDDGQSPRGKADE